MFFFFFFEMQANINMEQILPKHIDKHETPFSNFYFTYVIFQIRPIVRTHKWAVKMSKPWNISRIDSQSIMKTFEYIIVKTPYIIGLLLTSVHKQENNFSCPSRFTKFSACTQQNLQGLLSAS